MMARHVVVAAALWRAPLPTLGLRHCSFAVSDLLACAVRLQVKQSKCRAGCLDLDAAQLEAKEQEAARAAAELLEQLEKEQAAKVAKAAKKKKKGRSADACGLGTCALSRSGCTCATKLETMEAMLCAA